MLGGRYKRNEPLRLRERPLFEGTLAGERPLEKTNQILNKQRERSLAPWIAEPLSERGRPPLRWTLTPILLLESPRKTSL